MLRMYIKNMQILAIFYIKITLLKYEDERTNKESKNKTREKLRTQLREPRQERTILPTLSILNTLYLHTTLYFTYTTRNKQNFIPQSKGH